MTNLMNSGKPKTWLEAGIFRRGFNDPTEGAKRYLELDTEIGELEQHECSDEAFTSCALCENIIQRTHEQDQIALKWAKRWAETILKQEKAG